MKPSTRSEVDILLAQELKNHQDFIYQTNQSIQNLNNSIVSLSLLMEKAIAKSESDKRKILTDFEFLEEKMDSFCRSCTAKLGDMKTELLVLRDDFEEEVSGDKYVTHSHLHEKVQEIQGNTDLLELQSCRSLEYTRNEISSVKREMKAICDNFASLPIPPDLKPICKQVDELETIWKVNYQGIRQELNAIKKAMSYSDKKFENIYTLIKRLQEGTP